MQEQEEVDKFCSGAWNVCHCTLGHCHLVFMGGMIISNSAAKAVASELKAVDWRLYAQWFVDLFLNKSYVFSKTVVGNFSLTFLHACMS